MKTDNQVYLMFLISTAFLGLVFVETKIYLYAVLFLMFVFFVTQNKKESFYRPCFIALLFSLVLNAISSNEYRGQSYIETLKVDKVFFELFFFYALIYINPSLKVLDRVVPKLILTVLACYIFQIVIFPYALFGTSAAEWVQEGGKYQYRFIAVNGIIMIAMGFLYYLNRYLIRKERAALLLCMLCASVFLIRGYRIMIFGGVITAMWVYFRCTRNKMLFTKIFRLIMIAFGILIVTIFSYKIPVVQRSVDGLLERITSGEANLGNDSYIRIVSINYYYTSYFKNPIELILGSGLPHVDSSVGKFYFNQLLATNYNFYDWGYIGLSWFAGIPTVLCIIWMAIKSFLVKVPRQYYYIGAFFIYTIVVSFTDPEAYTKGAFTVQAFLMYYIAKIRLESIKFRNI